MAVRIEAGRIVERAKLQHPAPLRMLRCRLVPGYEPAEGGPGQRRARCRQECSTAQCGGLRVSVHTCPPGIQKLPTITPSMSKQSALHVVHGFDHRVGHL